MERQRDPELLELPRGRDSASLSASPSLWTALCKTECWNSVRADGAAFKDSGLKGSLCPVGFFFSIGLCLPLSVGVDD